MEGIRRAVVWRTTDAKHGKAVKHAYLCCLVNGSAKGRGEALCSYVTLGDISYWEVGKGPRCKGCVRVILDLLDGIPLMELIGE